MAVGLYRPALAPSHWDWVGVTWRPDFDAAACLRPLADGAAPPYATLQWVCLEAPPAAAVGPGAALVLFRLDGDGNPIEALDVDTFFPPE